MFSTKVHRSITHIWKLFYILKLWHRSDKMTVWQKWLKILYPTYCFLFPLSLAFGAVGSANKHESISLSQMSIVTTVLSVKMTFMIWKKTEILKLCDQWCVHSIADRVEFVTVKRKVNGFMGWVQAFYYTGILMGVCLILILPFIGNEKRLSFNIGFPLDYRESELAFWLAFSFTFTDVLLLDFACLFPILIWYLLLNCNIEYELLESQLRKLGVIGTDRMSMARFRNAVIVGIQSHQHTVESTNQLQAFLSEILSITWITSGMCICGSLYTIAFTVNKENIMECMIYVFVMLYNILDIFMITYFCNEIKLSSGRLLYCLFESNWIDQPQSCKKIVLVFGERLKQAHEMVILKLYPLNLESFTRILKSAYTLFNILKNVK